MNEKFSTFKSAVSLPYEKKDGLTELHDHSNHFRKNKLKFVTFLSESQTMYGIQYWLSKTLTKNHYQIR